MSEIVCVHKWTAKTDLVRQLEGDAKEIGWWSWCRRCEETWHDDKPEPRVVIARIEPQA